MYYVRPKLVKYDNRPKQKEYRKNEKNEERTTYLCREKKRRRKRGNGEERRRGRGTQGLRWRGGGKSRATEATKGGEGEKRTAALGPRLGQNTNQEREKREKKV